MKEGMKETRKEGATNKKRKKRKKEKKKGRYTR